VALVSSYDSAFVRALIENLGLVDKHVRRIVIDCAMDAAVYIYIECYGSEEVLNVAPPDIEGCKVTILHKGDDGE